MGLGVQDETCPKLGKAPNWRKLEKGSGKRAAPLRRPFPPKKRKMRKPGWPKPPDPAGVRKHPLTPSHIRLCNFANRLPGDPRSQKIGISDMIEAHRAAWFNRHKPKPPAAPTLLPGPAAQNVPDRHPLPLADRADLLLQRIFEVSKPIPLPPPGATETFKSGTRRVVSGPRPCRRFGER